MRLILRISPARKRAIAAARAETLTVLAPYQPSLPAGGPLGELGALFWVDLGAPGPHLEDRLALLGYVAAAYEITPLPSLPPQRPTSATEGGLPPYVRWRSSWYGVPLIWRRDEAEEREASPDRRPFLLPDPRGGVREVRGYRGDRRGLPPADARLTVNLALTPGCARLLDPFAGAGGIVSAARLHGLHVFSADIDPFVARGLSGLGAAHCIADARHLPLDDQSLDGVATEPPYEPELEDSVARSLQEFARVVRPGGRLSLFASVRQCSALQAAAASLPLILLHDFPIDRKGTPCEVLVWERR